MRLFAAAVLLLFVAVPGTKGQDLYSSSDVQRDLGKVATDACEDLDSDIFDKLKDVFGEINCMFYGDDTDELLNNPSFQCDANLEGWDVGALYKDFADEDAPRMLYFYWGSPIDFDPVDGSFSPLVEYETDFSRLCLDDFAGELALLKSTIELESVCRNKAAPFTYTTPQDVLKKTTCKSLRKKYKSKKLKQLCGKNPVIQEQCPGLCESRLECMCTDNLKEFRVETPERGDGRQKETTTCSALVGMSKEDKKKRCKRRRYRLSCPSICLSRCQEAEQISV